MSGGSWVDRVGFLFAAANGSVTKPLLIGCVYGILVLSYSGIMFNHYKNPLNQSPEWNVIGVLKVVQ